MIIKSIIFSISTLLILSLVGWIFWEQEYKFSLPTPIPQNLNEVAIGDSVIGNQFGNKGITYIHFYNRDCPCSRFNIQEFKNLVIKHSDQINFIAVLETKDLSKDEITEFKDKYDLSIPIIDDPIGDIANNYGVYSTPQVVIIKDSRIFYKGNYNKARFCLTRNTRFAEQALDAAVNNKPLPEFPEIAIVPYGCELPTNNESKSILSFLNL